jgi:hypothetical protein
MGQTYSLRPDSRGRTADKRGPLNEGGGFLHIGGPEIHADGDVRGTTLQDHLGDITYASERAVHNKKIKDGRGSGRVTRGISGGKGAEGGEDTGCCGRNCSRVIVEITSYDKRFACSCDKVKHFPMAFKANSRICNGGIIANSKNLAQGSGSDPDGYRAPRDNFGKKNAADR